MTEEKDKISEEIAKLSKRLTESPRNAELYYERGKLYWRLGNRSLAMTDFNCAVSLDPASPAADYLKMADDIMAFYHRDLYNP